MTSHRLRSATLTAAILVVTVQPPLARAQSAAAAGSDRQRQAQPKAELATESAPPLEASSGSLTLAERGAEGAAPSAGILAGRPNVVVLYTNTPPKIDGSLDDAVWRGTARIDKLVQQRPRQGVPATEQTDVYLAYDRGSIYFGIHAHYSDPSIMRVNRVDRDRIGRDDSVSVMFDPFLDQQRAYVFSVNGHGVQGDSLMGGGGGGGGGFAGGPGDPSWNALFHSAGTPVDDGWTAELAIPFKSLRYPARRRGEPHRWGFQIQRDIESKNESAVWSPVLRNVASFLGQMGTMDGLTNLSTSRNLEILPTFTAVRVDTLDSTSGAARIDNQPDGGLNVKYGITSNLTADFTFNPDFSQIESDRQQIEVNQRFPVFYPELRPFFLEGQEIFNVSGPVTFIHTRTIVDPKVGTKLTGKVGKTTLGVMVTNDEAPGRVDDSTDPVFGSTAQFLFGRVRYDMYSESHVGAVFTDREHLDGHSRVGGFDGRFRIGRTFRINLLTVFSDHLDGSSVRRTGAIYDVSFRKEGRGLTYSIQSSGVGPDFRSDAGFIRRTDIRQSSANLSYRWYPETWIVNWAPRVNYGRNYDYAGVLQDEDLGSGVMIQFARNVSLNTNFNHEMERFAGVDFRKTRYSIGGNVNASRRLGFGMFFNTGDQIRYVTDPFLGKGTNVNYNLNIRPFSRFESQVNLSTSNFIRPETGENVYDVKILRSVTTYQFTDRLTLRNIMQHNTYDKTLAVNILGTYRVNAGTACYIGYDDHFRQGDRINSTLFPTTELARTNRAVFAKVQYLFRY